MNALEIIQQASITLGFDTPLTIETPQDTNSMRLLGQLNRALEEIMRAYDWQCLTLEANFTADKKTHYNAKLGGYNIMQIAPGFGSFLTDYLYNKTLKIAVNSRTLDAYSADKVYKTQGLTQSFILRANHICLFGLENTQIATAQEIAFFYKNKNAVFNTDAQGNVIESELFAKNKDESLIDSKLLLRGLIWKFKAEMGYEYGEAYRDYELFFNKIKDQDANRRNIRENTGTQPQINLPDTGVGL
jgi:hypothetical protein